MQTREEERELAEREKGKILDIEENRMEFSFLEPQNHVWSIEVHTDIDSQASRDKVF